MGLFKSLGRAMFYPIVRPVEQAKTSIKQINDDVASLRQRRAERQLQSEEELRAHLERSQDPNWVGPVATEAELLNPALIKNPYARFEVLYSARGWTEEALLVQLNATKRTKRTAGWMCLALLTAGIINIFVSPVWIILITSPLLLVGSAIGLASAIKYAIWQSQLENRKLMGFKELASRRDFFSYLFLN